MAEPREVRLRRLHMRSMRRGIKEMDLILSAFASAELASMDSDMLDRYDELLGENDHDLYQWVTAQTPAPTRYEALIARISKALQH